MLRRCTTTKRTTSGVTTTRYIGCYIMLTEEVLLVAFEDYQWEEVQPGQCVSL